MADSKVRVLIAFYSRGGVTEALAKAIAEGVEREGGTAVLRRAREVVSHDIMAKAPGWTEAADRMNEAYEAPTRQDAAEADAIIFGSPTRFGLVSTELKAYIDSLGGLWQEGKLVGKVGAAFTSTSTPHGGNEATIISLYLPMAHFGMVIVPPGYADPAVFGTSTPYGVSAVSGHNSAPPNEGDLSVARYQGKRVVQVAQALKGNP